MTCRRRAARSASSAGPSSSGTTSVITCSRTASPCSQQRDRLRGEPLPVPEVRGAARHPADLGAADAQAVVVELGAEPQRGAVVGVEGQVDDGALGAQQAQRQGQRGGPAAALEHQVGAAVGGAVPPAGLEQHRGVDGVRVERCQPEGLGGRPALRGRVDHHHLLGAVLAGEQAGEQADDAGADDRDPPAADPVAERAHVGAELLGGGVQQPVGADRAHVRDVDAEQRVEVRRQRHDPVAQRVGAVAGAVAVGHGDGGAGGGPVPGAAVTSATSM